jgi:hypothetical protein
MAYDVEPLETIREKDRLLTAAARGGWTLVFEHDPDVASARVIETDKGFRTIDESAGLA